MEKIHKENLTADPTLLALLPLKNVVMLPKSIIPIIVGRPASIRATEFALKNNKIIFITAQKNADCENPNAEDVFNVGIKATILQVMRMPNGSLKILAEGINRARITNSEEMDGFLGVWAEDLPTENGADALEVEALWRQLSDLYTIYARLNEKAPTELISMAKSQDDFDYVTDTIAVHINLGVTERQSILESLSLPERMLRVCGFLQREIEILQTERRIRGLVQDQVDKNQREYYLTEQMKAIQKELGREDTSQEIQHIRDTVKNLGLSPEAYQKVKKELKRLEQMPPLSAEATISRHYIDWVTSLPWNKISTDSISITQAEKILDRSHAGLKKAKERIIEFLAAKKYSKNLERSPIICLVGPPGVGKTSLGKSVAESLGRDFVRISLGGLRDEAEIRGHRRTYIGALPGKVIQAMKKAETMNPVILLDEIDKMSQDIHGDPASALLEVLDSEQNKTFVDHFLEIEYDLSKVMFIATANTMDGIPYPLLDRMEIISLSGYTEQEKFDIAKNFLISKNLHEYGLTKQKCKISPEIITILINHYTKEAGVRQLERIIAKIMRKSIQALLKDPRTKSITVTPDLIREWLGNYKFKKTSLATTPRIGLATGLAWTEVGGDVLEIEATVLPGKGGLTLTGQLGEVMQESAHAALSYIRSRASELGLKNSFYASKDIHIHIPEGATPKDGPSAGITMCVALISALTHKPNVKHLAMTGEVTLQGRVLAIGGIKEKLLAAKQHGMTHVILPKENQDEVQEVLKEIDMNGVELIFVSTMDEVVLHAFDNVKFAKTVERASKRKTKPGNTKSRKSQKS